MTGKIIKTIEADVWMTQMLNLIYKKDSKELYCKYVPSFKVKDGHNK